MKKSVNQGIVDRFEGDYAVVEYGDRRTFDLPKSLLPSNVKEGDVVLIELSIDEEETQKRRKSIEALTKSLFRD
ncbi:DUF3006 domain-containing protein [Alkaliphilus transvaalensis]|uniref:DUF3006 domain-containing protein n=1 Tax=Alkaliphilus transvaalensis TaxID=114628 RepID=UPI00047A68DF|nr:DUF3006 domain-containing protein [Alkaliphilus transvaalensis]